MLTWRTLLLPLFFFFSCAVHPRDLHSFPTRRSSDLTRSGAPLGGGGGDVMVQVVRLNHASAAEMAERLEPLLSNEGLITPYPAHNTLVIADRRHQLATIQQLIGELDRSGDVEIDVLTLSHATARDVLHSLTSLYPPEIGRASCRDRALTCGR